MKRSSCPFCGHEFEIIPINFKIGEQPGYYFSCTGCHIESTVRGSKESVLEHINSRKIYIKIKDDPVASTEEIRPGIFLDYDKDGLLVGIEQVTL